MRAAAIVVFLLFAGAAVLPRARVDNSVDALLAANDAGADRYEAFRALFGTDEIIVAQVTAPDLDRLVAATSSVSAILRDDPATAHVVDPTVVYSDTIAVVTDEIFQDDPEAMANAIAATKGPLGRRLGLLDLETKRATIYAFTRVVAPAEREALAAALDDVRSRAATDQVRIRLAGPPLLNLTLDRAGRDVQRTALPLLIVVCLIVCLIVLRSVRATIAVFLPVGLTVLATDGLYGLTGQSTNLVVDIAKPLLFVLLLAGSLHLVAAYRASFDGDGVRAARDAVASKGRPAALALVTTAIGFGSLAFASIHPIRMFGIVASLGLLVGIATVLLVVPAALSWVWPDPRPLDADPIAGVAERLVAFAQSTRAVWIVVAVGVLGFGGWAYAGLETEPHAIRYFPPNHPLRSDYEALERDGLGLATLELVVTSTSRWDEPRALAALDALAQRIEALDGVRAVVGPPLVLREVVYAARQVDELPGPVFASKVFEERPAILDQFLTKDRKTARLAATIATLDAAALDHLATAIEDGEHPAGTTITTTGNYRLLLDAQRGLLDTLTNSLFTTFVLMQLILFIALRSFRLGAVAIVPNLIPVAGGFVLMRLFDIRLDIGTTMTAAIALGIAVDDTLHFMLAAKKDGVMVAARTTGQAIVSSSLVISAGFFVLLTTSFGPTRSFGLLAGTAMATALIADLVVLPALLKRS